MSPVELTYPWGHEAAALRYLRGEARLTQREMAEVIGASVTSISYWESGRSKVPTNVLIRAAHRAGFVLEVRLRRVE